jgi:DNA/RNA-binding domain of Phe-tRNA-synthetase-like protein
MIEVDNAQKIEWLVPESKSAGLSLGIAEFSQVKVVSDLSSLKNIEKEIFQEIHSKYTIDNLKNDPKIRAYRDFFWKWKIADPTKVRPASEALIRRILLNKKLWKINTFVNAYNLASAITGISLGAYDKFKIKLPIQVRFAKEKEEFIGIGMSEAKVLNKNKLILADQKGIISIYPHRDADRTKITEKSKNIFLLAFGVPGITKDDLKISIEKTAEILERIDSGSVIHIHIYDKF